jgi:hypothetical protein
MSRGLLISRQTILKLSSLASKHPSIINISNFKLYRNLYNKTLRAAKKIHFSNAIANNTKNLKKTWSILKLALKFFFLNSTHD